jgi:hypothetical protein
MNLLQAHLIMFGVDWHGNDQGDEIGFAELILKLFVKATLSSYFNYITFVPSRGVQEKRATGDRAIYSQL